MGFQVEIMPTESVFQVEVISRSVIKPSSPTPDHLRRLKLSLFDQLAPPLYISIGFLYEATDHDELIKTLQESLSKALTLFYAFAGKFDFTDFSVNCNDDGVDFVEARVNSRLEDLLKDHKLDGVDKYFPVDPLESASAREGKPFMVQITNFACGGIAIGACMSHTIGDAWSIIEFMNSWTAACRRKKLDDCPSYQFGKLEKCFPTTDLSWMRNAPDVFGNDEFVTKRFVFGKDQLADLKKAAAAPGKDFVAVMDPTRVEALSAFIWKNSIDNYVAEGKKRFCAMHAVNIRSRASKSLQLDHTVGNAVITTTAFADRSGVEGGTPPQYPELVSILRNAFRDIGDEYIRKTQSEHHHLNQISKFFDRVKRGEIDEFFLFTSWTRFPMYEVDFGWGPPVWNFSSGSPVKNTAVFLSTIDGDGIEVWITLLPGHVESLEEKIKLIGSQS